jgi:hypothetical protein
MVTFRFLSVLAPRLSQLLGWTADTTRYGDPLLKREETPRVKQQIRSNRNTIQPISYQPPIYTPPSVPTGRS